ncbi:two-component system response regulator [Massilia sp. LC238]|uniref:response regulator n=1 Tax=Massilia sp. LC238 TaxID=1502852 RepID=UPI0009E06B9B|nr:response regulator [Massilia sp. LC238]
MENFSGTRILLVERDNDVRNLFEIFLFGQGYSVCTAKEPSEAFSIIKLTPPNVVFSSLVFHEMDGFKFCQKLRLMPEMKSTLIVALTGYSETNVEQKAIDSGFDKFFLKPISVHDMVEVIEQHRSGQASHRLMRA